jgi:Protein of unknown function (DUF3826)
MHLLTHASPSPLPSPAGRGRILRRLIEKLAAGFTRDAVEMTMRIAPCSLSSGERVGVRGSATLLYACICCLFATQIFSAETNSVPEPKDAAYTQVLNERVTKIVAPLAIADSAKSNSVHAVIVQQYRSLNDIHFVRDVEITNAKKLSDKTAATAAIQTARDNAKPKLDKLHGEFLAKISAELSPDQVNEVKDGLTYHVLPLTYGVYLRMYPDLTAEQKAQIKSWLTEARELAMDGSTSDEKHAVFGKYKGKINNYLSKAGYDAKKAEQNLKKPSQSTSETKQK